MNRRSTRNRHRRRPREQFAIETRVVWHSPDHVERVTEYGSIGVVDFMPIDVPRVTVARPDNVPDLSDGPRIVASPFNLPRGPRSKA